MAIETNIASGNVFVGSDIQLDFLILQSDNATPQNMTGWSLEFVLRENPTKEPEFFTKTVGSGITIGNGSGTNDKASVSIARVDTQSLRPGKYWYTLWRTDAGFNIPLAYGTIDITSVTDL